MSELPFTHTDVKEDVRHSTCNTLNAFLTALLAEGHAGLARGRGGGGGNSYATVITHAQFTSVKPALSQRLIT